MDLRFRVCREKRKSELATFAQFAFFGDPAPLLLDQSSRDGQPQSRSLLRVRCTTLDLPEFVEDNLLILRRDPDPRIGYRGADEVPVVHTLDADPATLGRELDRVAEQVVQNLLKSYPVCLHFRLAL